MRFMDRTKKKGVATKNQAKLSKRVVLRFRVVKALVSVTAWFKGKNTLATICTPTGKSVIGKNVPLKMNIGVINRNAG